MKTLYKNQSGQLVVEWALMFTLIVSIVAITFTLGGMKINQMQHQYMEQHMDKHLMNEYVIDEKTVIQIIEDIISKGGQE